MAKTLNELQEKLIAAIERTPVAILQRLTDSGEDNSIEQFSSSMVDVVLDWLDEAEKPIDEAQ